MLRPKLRLLQVGTVLAGAILISGGAAGKPALAQLTTQPSAKVKSCNISVACIGGNNAGFGVGVLGVSAGNDGIDATTTNPSSLQRPASGLYGYDGSTDGGYQNNGIAGFSPYGTGAYGVSTYGIGTFGLASSVYPGIQGSNIRYGYLQNGQNFGVFGYSLYGDGVAGYTANPSFDGFAVHAYGDLAVDGVIWAGGGCQGCSRTRREQSFGALTSRPTIDDVGEGALRDGVAAIGLASDFSRAIDTTKPYVVLLTPEGDASLYVANRTASGFEVRQIGGGHSSVAFAYRIVAKPYGVKDMRLPFRNVPDTSKFHARRTAR